MRTKKSPAVALKVVQSSGTFICQRTFNPRWALGAGLASQQVRLGDTYHEGNVVCCKDILSRKAL